MSDLKSVLERLRFGDDAKVQTQLVDQILRAKTRLALVRRKILVLSGKGGVGKSAVTAQLALALGRQGVRVGILDADLNGPCIPRMLGLSGRRLSLEGTGARPPEGPHGIKVASMAFVSDARGPVRWKGPMDLTPVWLGMMESAVIREFISDIIWGELDTLLFDLPPGAAADKPPAIVNLIPDIHGALVVTTPSLVALEVVRRSIIYARDLGIPILGVVENMSGLFGGSAASLAEEMEVPLLERIPLDSDLSRSLDSGRPLPAEHPISRLFDELAGRLR